MMRVRCLATLLAILLPTGFALADDLTGAGQFLCSATTASVCGELGECAGGPPWALNIPQFIQVDLEKKTLSTTAASGEARSTPIKNLERAEGMIAIQGFEQGRAFSFLIDQKTGFASIAVARDGLGVVVFAACTPMSASR